MLRGLVGTAVALGALAAPAAAGVGDILDPRHQPPEVLAVLDPAAQAAEELLPALPYDQRFIGRPVQEWTFVPQGRLYPARLAELRYPRLAVRIIGSPGGHRPQLEVELGGAWSWARWHPDSTDDWGFEVGGYAAIAMRFDLEHETDLLGTDGMWGFPVSWRYGTFALKLQIGHISGHIGDETIFHQGKERLNYLKEELTFGFAWEPYRFLRFYGEFAGAMRLGADHGKFKTRPFRAQWGAELVPHEVWPGRWPVYLALDCTSRQEVGWNITTNLEIGYVLWSDGLKRSWRMAVNWYRGREVLTQFHYKRTQWWAISLLADW